MGTLKTSVEIEIEFEVDYHIDPGQRAILNPTDRAQPGFPAHVDDMEFDLVLPEGVDLKGHILFLISEAIDKEALEQECMDDADARAEAALDDYYDSKYQQLKEEGRFRGKEA